MKNKFKIKSLSTRCDHCKGSGNTKEVFAIIDKTKVFAIDFDRFLRGLENKYHEENNRHKEDRELPTVCFSWFSIKGVQNIKLFVKSIGCRIHTKGVYIWSYKKFKPFMDNFCKRYDACHKRIK